MARKSRKAAMIRHLRRILAIDIGGTGLKAALIAPTGKLSDRSLRVEDAASPHAQKNRRPLSSIWSQPLKGYDHVSIGFPGYVRDGKVFTAPHLGTKAWAGFTWPGRWKKTGKARHASSMMPMCRAWR